MTKAQGKILESISSYINENPVRMHMPGHKGVSEGRTVTAPQQILEAAKALDLTEIPGMDNLHYPVGPIKETEESLAKAFGTSSAYCLINGASCGIMASLLAVRMTFGKGRVIVPRNAHRSIMSGLVLSGLEPLFVYPTYDSHLGGYLPVEASDIRDQLGVKDLDIGSIKAIVIVNPTYFGVARDMGDICGLAAEMGIPVIVDEAHGTLFSFSDSMPPSAIKYGAHLVVHGAHKTTKAFTQTGMLHVTKKGQERFPHLSKNVQEALRLVQSTSPSYLLLASLENAAKDLYTDSEWVNTTVKLGNSLADLLAEVPGIKVQVPGPKTQKCGTGADIKGKLLWDPGKILVDVFGLRISGPEAGALLWEKGRVVPEMTGPNHVLFMVTGSDSESTIIKVTEAFRKVSQVCLSKNNQKSGLAHQAALENSVLAKEPPRLKQVTTAEEAFYSDSWLCPISRLQGKISADTVLIYPPGAPVIAPGEKITPDVVEYLEAAIDFGLNVSGRGYCKDQRELNIFCMKE